MTPHDTDGQGAAPVAPAAPPTVGELLDHQARLHNTLMLAIGTIDDMLAEPERAREFGLDFLRNARQYFGNELGLLRMEDEL